MKVANIGWSLALVLMPIMALGDSGEWEDPSTGWKWYWNDEDGEMKIIAIEWRGGEDQYITGLTTPTALNGKTVKRIGLIRTWSSDWEYNYRYITGVTVSEGVTRIEDGSFANCSKLTRVTLPSTLKSIGQSVFENCTALTSITLSDGLQSIGRSAFAGCDSLTELKIPSSVKSIGANALDCAAYWNAVYREWIGPDGTVGGVSPHAKSGSGGGGDGGVSSMTVSGDTVINVVDGNSFDIARRVVNTSDGVVRLSLPSGYVYETIGDADPLEIPAQSTNVVTITRTADRTFLVSRQQLRKIRSGE